MSTTRSETPKTDKIASQQFTRDGKPMSEIAQDQIRYGAMESLARTLERELSSLQSRLHTAERALVIAREYLLGFCELDHPAIKAIDAALASQEQQG